MAEATFSLDLHVLGPPLTFALSQDQTLQLNLKSHLARESVHQRKLLEPSRTRFGCLPKEGKPSGFIDLLFSFQGPRRPSPKKQATYATHRYFNVKEKL